MDFHDKSAVDTCLEFLKKAFDPRPVKFAESFLQGEDQDGDTVFEIGESAPYTIALHRSQTDARSYFVTMWTVSQRNRYDEPPDVDETELGEAANGYEIARLILMREATSAVDDKLEALGEDFFYETLSKVHQK